jgi:hypothetical protein
MSILNTSTSWNVGRAAGRCAACGREILPTTECWATLCDGPPAAPVQRPASAPAKAKADAKADAKAEEHSPFVRLDFCLDCWQQGRRPENLPREALGLPAVVEAAAEGHPRLDMFSFWKTTVPEPQQKKKLLVDDSVLVDVFQRMEGKSEPQEVRFRFVLALILMRKKLLKYEGMEPVAEVPPATDPSAPPAPRPPEVWRMQPKAPEGWGAAVHVVNPHLTPDQVAEVSQQLSAILAEEV